MSWPRLRCRLRRPRLGEPGGLDRRDRGFGGVGAFMRFGIGPIAAFALSGSNG